MVFSYGPRGQLRRAAYAAGTLAAAGRAAYRARHGTASAARARRAVGRSFTRTRTRRRGQSGVGVTKENDVRFVYGKRRMPFRRRRSWRRFTKKVYAVSEKQRGTQSIAFNTVKRESVPADTQRMYGITLYGYNGSGPSGPDAYDSDMSQIAGMTKPGDTPVSPLVYNRKLHFRSAVLDITFRNLGVTQVEIDIYEYIVKKDIRFARLIDMIVDAQTDIQAVAPATTLTHDDVGVTPFQLTAALRYITILKKTKVFLSTTDGVATYQIRKPANRWWTTTQINEETATFAKRGWTVGILCVQKGVPGFISPNIQRAQASDVVMSITRTYTLKTVDNQEFSVSGFVAT